MLNRAARSTAVAGIVAVERNANRHGYTEAPTRPTSRITSTPAYGDPTNRSAEMAPASSASARISRTRAPPTAPRPPDDLARGETTPCHRRFDAPRRPPVPNDPRNLWIEPGGSPNPKDGVESRLHQLVCEGRVSLGQAQQAIATTGRRHSTRSDDPTSRSVSAVPIGAVGPRYVQHERLGLTVLWGERPCADGRNSSQ